MAIVTLFAGTFCREHLLVPEVVATCGCDLVTDRDVVELAGRQWDVPNGTLMKAFEARTSVFNPFTREKERSIAFIRAALADVLKETMVVEGFSSHLVPGSISHALRVCLIADRDFRVRVAMQDQGLVREDAANRIAAEDEDRRAWVKALHGAKDPWDPALYDIVLPADKVPLPEAVDLIRRNMGKNVVQIDGASRRAMEEFRLGARVQATLAREGHNVAVTASGDRVTLTIGRPVVMLDRLQEELTHIAAGVPGVAAVTMEVAEPRGSQDAYRKFDNKAPSKVLLVDDEREFVQTLSERLLMRDVGSAVAYDGESALHFIEEDEPEVMILDLKMPGIDGMEVLRRVKQSNPEIEVIILTGHGSEADRKVCMGLGAFAYLQKPVDIELLSETLRKANDKVRGKKPAAL